MRMELRIPGAARAMPKRRRHKPVPEHTLRTAVTAPSDRALALHVPQRPGHRRLMRLSHLPRHLPVAETEKHAHALRRTEREIETGNANTAPRRAHQRLPRLRVLARQDATKQLALDLARELKLVSSAPRPRARRLTRARVVVLDPLANRLQVVIRLPRAELPDREHPPHSAASPGSGAPWCKCVRRFPSRVAQPPTGRPCQQRSRYHEGKRPEGTPLVDQQIDEKKVHVGAGGRIRDRRCLRPCSPCVAEADDSARRVISSCPRHALRWADREPQGGGNAQQSGGGQPARGDSMGSYPAPVFRPPPPRARRSA